MTSASRISFALIFWAAASACGDGQRERSRTTVTEAELSAHLAATTSARATPQASSAPSPIDSQTGPSKPSVHISKDGYLVSAWGQNWGPPCSAPPQKLIPLSNGTHDKAALQRCLRWVKDHSKDPTDIAIQFVAEESVRYSSLIDAMDAARSDPSGDLFPEMTMGATTGQPDASP